MQSSTTITVATVERKIGKPPRNAAYLIVVDTNGVKWSVFDAKQQLLFHPGAIIHLVTEKKDGSVYTDIVSASVANTAPPTHAEIATAHNNIPGVVPVPVPQQVAVAVAPTAQQFKAVGEPDNFEIRKGRTMCLAYAKDLVVAGKLDFRNLYLEADTMLNWAMTGEFPLFQDAKALE